MGAEPTRLELEIEHEGVPQIHGSLAAAGRAPVPFTGWLQLISLIERASDQGQGSDSGRGAG